MGATLRAGAQLESRLQVSSVKDGKLDGRKGGRTSEELCEKPTRRHRPLNLMAWAVRKPKDQYARKISQWKALLLGV